MTYELPVDGYDGRVELQTLARRVARACVHFIQVSSHSPDVTNTNRDTDLYALDQHGSCILGPRDLVSP